MSVSPSKSRVNKAGKRLRRALLGDSLIADDVWEQELAVVRSHRAAHRQPMVTANVSLRQYCGRKRLNAKITQRLKRMDTILEKLTREPTLQLGNMQDIGGVRVVLPTLEEVQIMAQWLLKNHPSALVSDYIQYPRVSGYRAIHVVTEWGQEPRKPVEIQLRSDVMNAWADMVEETSGILGINYKQDRTSTFNDWACAVSRIMEARELGNSPTEEMQEELEAARVKLVDTWRERLGG